MHDAADRAALRTPRTPTGRAPVLGDTPDELGDLSAQAPAGVVAGLEVDAAVAARQAASLPPAENVGNDRLCMTSWSVGSVFTGSVFIGSPVPRRKTVLTRGGERARR